MGKLWVFFSAFILTLSFVLYAFANHAMVIRENEKSLPGANLFMAQQKNEFPDIQNGLGVKEIPRADGGTDKIYYSIVTPEEEQKKEREEKEKQDRSWEMLPGIIVNKHTR
jgi:hypothetical protein